MRSPLPPWEDRSPDYRNLFNPAFVALIISAICHGFQSRAAKDRPEDAPGLQFALLFLAVALALSPKIRSERPKRLNQQIENWLKTNIEAQAHIADAAYSLAPTIKEGLIVALRSGNVEVGADGTLAASSNFKTNHGNRLTEINIRRHVDDAIYIGRWLAKGGTSASILHAFGLRP